MKKLSAIILAVVMTAIMLTSCNGNSNTSQSKETSGDQVTLKLTGWRVEDQDAINSMNEIFTKENPNIKIEYNPIKATEYDTSLQTALSNKTAEDIIMIRSYSGGKAVYSGGQIVTLTTKEIPELANFPKSAIEAWSSDDGKIFAVPGSMTLEGVHYNKKIFKECGITKTPETLEELIEDCKKIKEKGYTPFATGIKDAWFVSEEITSTILMAVIGSNDWINKLYNKEINFEDAKYVEMFQILMDISEYFPQSYEGLSYENSQQMFLAEQAAMYLSGTFEIQYFQETNPDLELGGFSFPGKNSAATAMNSTFVNGFGIYSGTKHKEEALKYLNWLASKEGGQAYANNVAGFFSLNPKASDLQNDVVKEWVKLKDGKEIIHMLGYECMTEEVPDYTTAVADSVYQMMVNKKTPKEAAAYMQQQMSWYFK